VNSVVTDYCARDSGGIIHDLNRVISEKRVSEVFKMRAHYRNFIIAGDLCSS
jgi:hypothetical protein